MMFNRGDTVLGVKLFLTLSVLMIFLPLNPLTVSAKLFEVDPVEVGFSYSEYDWNDGDGYLYGNYPVNIKRIGQGNSHLQYTVFDYLSNGSNFINPEDIEVKISDDDPWMPLDSRRIQLVANGELTGVDKAKNIYFRVNINALSGKSGVYTGVLLAPRKGTGSDPDAPDITLTVIIDQAQNTTITIRNVPVIIEAYEGPKRYNANHPVIIEIHTYLDDWQIRFETEGLNHVAGTYPLEPEDLFVSFSQDAAGQSFNGGITKAKHLFADPDRITLYLGAKTKLSHIAGTYSGSIIITFEPK